MRDLHFPGRSPVRAMNGVAATSHPLSTLAAIEMLRSGGNAMDAAVCAAAVQAVVEPQSTGIGGDCFVLFAPRGSADVIAFNGSGRSPAAATLDWYLDKGFTELPMFGPHAVTVPGAIDAWCRLLEDHGEKGIEAALAPAIRYAEEGYVIHDRVACDFVDSMPALQSDPVAGRLFLKDGEPLRAGEVHRQPELAATMRVIAKKGRDGFYEGDVAEDLVRRLNELGGLHTLDDFKATSGDYVDPVSASYGDLDVHQMPPSNQGLTALLMLNILSAFDLSGLDPNGVERLHLEIEAGRLAYRDRDRHIGDPASVRVPASELLSQGYAERLAAEIRRDKAMTHLPNVPLTQNETVYISVVDRDRNAVSFINSTYDHFGSGVAGPLTGVVLQNRGRSFRLVEGHPNALAPRKRPMHTIMPGMATANGRAVMPFGVMGGSYQPFGHVHVITNLVDFGFDPQEALDSPRVFFDNGQVEAERGVPQATVDGLRQLWHEVTTAAWPHGGGQIVRIDWESGTLTGASDPRKDGCAIGY